MSKAAGRAIPSREGMMQKFEITEGGTAPAEGPSGNRILIALAAVCAIVTVVAIVVAVVAVSRSSTTPNITIRGDQTTIGGSTSGQGSSAGSSAGISGSAVSSSSGGRIFTIAVGHDLGPFEYVDTSGYLTGFHHDLIEAVCTEAGMDCRTIWDKHTNCWDSTPGQPSHGGQGLMGRWYDACTGWFRTLERIQVFSFSSPFLKPPSVHLFVKKGNAVMFPSKNLANKTIGFVDGWACDERCLARWTDVTGQDNMTVVHAPTPGDIFAKLKSGEMDAAFLPFLAMAGHASGANPEFEQVPWGGFYCTEAGNGMMTRKDNDFTSHWNVGFSKLVSSGKFKKLCDAAAAKHGFRGPVDCVDG
ncbi:uncharacterized protein LOC106158589 [Lingula anatina]|uniref:Uncharacterized protein LOC106158589 n=1 Tax=Lingula anatina TaxID=7574 RepID=A0A1S3HX16_LINAN|nr:uncharacterized protein LOC106158589 [Lingula anatina]|eukprot:XP_013390096.1 uncharacterized protein LOC106158589 [Lingula anatina]